MKITSLTAGILALAGSMAAPVGSEAASLGIVFVSDGHRPSPYRAGYGRGYDDGMREGAHDGRRHEVFSYWDERRYIHCGYHSSYGPRHVYQSGYRQGFEAGYRQSYYASYRCERDGRKARYAHADDDWAYRDRGDERRDEYRDDR